MQLYEKEACKKKKKHFLRFHQGIRKNLGQKMKKNF